MAHFYIGIFLLCLCHFSVGGILHRHDILAHAKIRHRSASYFVRPENLKHAVGLPAKQQKRGALSYVVSQGCPYLTHYVRDNYFGFKKRRSSATTTASSILSTVTTNQLNWVAYVYDRGVNNYIPMELIHGLINCGKKYALYGVDPPQSVLHLLHVDFTGIPGVLDAGCDLHFPPQ